MTGDDDSGDTFVGERAVDLEWRRRIAKAAIGLATVTKRDRELLGACDEVADADVCRVDTAAP